MTGVILITLFELGFPSFQGQSGSPVLSSDWRVIGVISSVIKVEDGLFQPDVRWSIAVSLYPLKDWLQQVVDRVS